jgi:uncharacterized membrane protein (UPF0136 family)
MEQISVGKHILAGFLIGVVIGLVLGYFRSDLIFWILMGVFLGSLGGFAVATIRQIRRS